MWSLIRRLVACATDRRFHHRLALPYLETYLRQPLQRWLTSHGRRDRDSWQLHCAVRMRSTARKSSSLTKYRSHPAEDRWNHQSFHQRCPHCARQKKSTWTFPLLCRTYVTSTCRNGESYGLLVNSSSSWFDWPNRLLHCSR